MQALNPLNLMLVRHTFSVSICLVYMCVSAFGVCALFRIMFHFHAS